MRLVHSQRRVEQRRGKSEVGSSPAQAPIRPLQVHFVPSDVAPAGDSREPS